MRGWCGLPQDSTLAKEYLKKSAELGHAQAIYDFTRDVLRTPEVELAKQYINQALQQHKLDDIKFDFDLYGYKQGSMKHALEYLLQVIESTSALPPIPGCMTNKGTMTLISNGVEFDDVDFYGIDLKGSIPLSPRTKEFLESKGKTVTQNNGKITFTGDFFNTFSRKEIADFLAQRSSYVITNKGTMTVTSNGVEFDEVDFGGIDLKGGIPLSPRTKEFLESKGNTVTQNNEKITFTGDFFNTFSRKEVVDFLIQRLAPKPQL